MSSPVFLVVFSRVFVGGRRFLSQKNRTPIDSDKHEQFLTFIPAGIGLKLGCLLAAAFVFLADVDWASRVCFVFARLSRAGHACVNVLLWPAAASAVCGGNRV